MVRPMQDRLMGMLKAEDSLIQPWEIAVLYRQRASSHGARATVTWARVAPEKVDALVDEYRTGVLAPLQQLPGFCSLSLLVDRTQGRTVSVTTFDDRETLERTRDQVLAIREKFARATGARIVDVAEMDVVVAHLGVPATV